ncbi:MAG TPA: amylo-alpha-1,6-glucosidase [Verrucomicrobiae bacterium]|nr:amylo-alpha-1,6-glucosidase [Verrucomicrobiae bacterium]
MSSQPPDLVRKIDLTIAEPAKLPEYLQRQWLITNGLGGYASGTISGAITWRYHGLLIAALPAPLGRTLMLNHLAESVRLPDRRLIQFGGVERSDPTESEGPNYLKEFRLENQLPFWRYDIDGVILQKRLLMLYLQNTVHITYELLSGPEGIQLELRPSVHFRPFEGNVGAAFNSPYEIRNRGQQFEIDSHEVYPPLRLMMDDHGSHFTSDGGSSRDIFYELDAQRGYESRGVLWSPGYFSVPLKAGSPVTFMASTENWHTMAALDPDAAASTELERRKRLLRIAHPEVQQGAAAELVLAADQFIMVPAGRIKDAARARASGDQLRSVIAGYHWFTDWGRDTMISLEGLTLTTCRSHEAAWILRTFAHYVKDGLIPNMFPEGQNEGLYHTADATLWFFHALQRYVQVTGDRETLIGLLPVLRDIVDHHLSGTKFGIGVDPKDGLLREGQEGYQLTWMDAKVGDWVVTPRRGKPVEINALWYNALCILEQWLREENETSEADVVRDHARRARQSFNERFWNPALNCLFDVIDGEQGNDAAIRPNQIFSISLPHPILDEQRWPAVFKIVEEKLLTPLGLRSLSREHPDYKVKYFGDLRSRDAAYHQGTVWAWLIGPFIDAWLKLHPENPGDARKFLEGFIPHLSEGCIGSISEVFDAEAPYTQRGCIAQAWSVAEVLRGFALTAER